MPQEAAKLEKRISSIGPEYNYTALIEIIFPDEEMELMPRGIPKNEENYEDDIIYNKVIHIMTCSGNDTTIKKIQEVITCPYAIQLAENQDNSLLENFKHIFGLSRMWMTERWKLLDGNLLKSKSTLKFVKLEIHFFPIDL